MPSLISEGVPLQDLLARSAGPSTALGQDAMGRSIVRLASPRMAELFERVLPIADPLWHHVQVKSPRHSATTSPAEVLRRAALAEVRAVYLALESRPVERACTRITECCQFKLTGRTPQLTKGEAILAARALRASGRKAMPERGDGACPMLRENGACMIYQDRPFGCRTHFCAAAGGPYARNEVIDLIRRLEAADAHLGGDGPRAIEAAVREELR